MICGTTQLVPLMDTPSIRRDARWQVLLNLSWMLGAPPAVPTQKFRSTAVGVNRPGLALFRLSHDVITRRRARGPKPQRGGAGRRRGGRVGDRPAGAVPARRPPR